VKTLELEKTSPEVRRAAHLARGDILVLTENGKPAFAIVGVKDELALEALALGRNTEFMAYLDGVSERAGGGERHSLKDIQEEFGIAAPRPKAATGGPKPQRAARGPGRGKRR
jgi:hypothetical protein